MQHSSVRTLVVDIDVYLIRLITVQFGSHQQIARLLFNADHFRNAVQPFVVQPAKQTKFAKFVLDRGQFNERRLVVTQESNHRFNDRRLRGRALGQTGRQFGIYHIQN